MRCRKADLEAVKALVRVVPVAKEEAVVAAKVMVAAGLQGRAILRAVVARMPRRQNDGI
jgi:hypothetical protein